MLLAKQFSDLCRAGLVIVFDGKKGNVPTVSLIAVCCSLLCFAATHR